MARAKSSAIPTLSLFPFLSILACLSGALVVMICVLSIVQVTTSGSTAAKTNPLAQEMQALQKQLNEFRTLTDQMTTIEQAEKRIVLLQELAKDADTTDALRARLEAEIKNMQVVIANLQNQKPQLQKEIAKLKEDLAERRIDPAQLKPALRVQGGGSGFAVGRRLFVIEANSDSVTVHRDKENRFRVSAATIGADKDYNDFLAEVAAHKNHLVLFLVRTDGWNSYVRGAGWAEQKFNLATSKMPIPGQGRVDLSEFEKFMK
jgi:hypothetical protein